MNQSEFLAITSNAPKAREKSRVYGAIGFGFASHWLKNWRESFKPITKRSNRNHVISFDSHLKTTLMTEKQTLEHCCFSTKGTNCNILFFLHNGLELHTRKRGKNTILTGYTGH